MTIPDIDEPKPGPRIQRPVVFAAVLGGGICLLTVIVGLILIGLHEQDVGQDAITALATIGGSLAGGFAGWIARGSRVPTERHDDR